MKRGETITEAMLINDPEGRDHIRTSIKYWETMILTYTDECDGRKRAREQLAAWQEVARKAGMKV